MSDMIYYKNGEETFRISPPTVGTKCPETKLEVKKMNEIEKTEGEIKVLQAKLELLKEMENFKTPAEEAYKRVYGNYPDTGICNGMSYVWWDVFCKGYNASKEDYKVEEPKKEQKWDVVRESVKWCEEHPDESVEEYLKPHTPEKTEQLLREAFKKVQQTEEWKETQRKIDSNYDELVESETSPPEPTSTVFRQKLFDGIKSVFYDPDYERTHWKMKVDMAVDEVLTHFYDIIPEPFEKELQDDFEKGWNSCLKSIEIYMEFGDD
jgi:hypothetical protein